ncbi:MAG: GNAT family N-acetyltransferase [Bacteroidales bacterium]
MIRYLQHNDIDFDKWDECIDNSLNGIIYPYSWYLGQVAPGWDALVMGDYEAVMPVTYRKKAGIFYIFQPFFVQQLGVFSPQPVSSELLKEFLDHIPGKFKFADYNLNTYNIPGKDFMFNLNSRSTYELDLISPYQNIKEGYSENTRRNLKKAEKSGIFITPASSPDDIIRAFRMYRGKSLKQFGEDEYQMLKHLIYSGIHRGNAVVYNAYDKQNSFTAGVVFFHSHKKSILIFSGSTPEARKNGSMTAIIDRYISDYSGKNITLDFEGSEDENLARFYKGFGSKECYYFQLIINNFPLILKPVANMYFWFRKKTTVS